MDNMKSVSKGVAFIALLALVGIVWADTSSVETTVLMKYQEAIITRADFDAEIQRIPETSRNEVLASRSRVGLILENILLNRVFSLEAKKNGIDKNPALVNELRLAEDRLLTREYLNAQLEKVKLPDFEARAKELYRLNQEKYTIKPLADVSHILITAKDGKKDAALKQAADLYKQILAGADFEALAASHSDDKSAAKNRGRLGYFSPDQMVTEFTVAAFALDKPGDISKPVESKFGYHIIKLHNKKNGGLQDFAAVKEGIIDGLRADFVASARKEIIDKVRGSADLEINEAEVVKLNPRLADPGKMGDGTTGNGK